MISVDLGDFRLSFVAGESELPACPHWRCSQESPTRAIGIVFGLEFEKTGDRLKMEIQSSCGVDGWITAKTWRVELEPDQAEAKERTE